VRAPFEARFNVVGVILMLLTGATGCENVAPDRTQPFDLHPKAVHFSASPPGSHSMEAVVLSNRAGRPLSFDTKIDAASAAFDTTFSTCPEPLPAGEECAVFVSFSPVEAGAYRQRLCVSAGATQSCVALTGVAPALPR
jgi:hypothetical protein